MHNCVEVLMKKKLYVWSFLALTLLYAALSLGLPSDPKVLEKYQLTQTHAHLVNLTLVVPLTLVWLSALYGFLRFKHYTAAILESNEGRPFSQLSSGLMILAYSLPLLAIVSLLSSFYAYHHPDSLRTVTVFKNYANLSFPIAAFVLISKGAKGLIKTHKVKAFRQKRNAGLLATITMSSTYIWLITTRPITPTGDTAYFLPNWLVIFTLAIPYLFIWILGINAALDLYWYKAMVRGTVYKSAIGSLARGIAAIVVVSVCIQVITTSTAGLTRLKFTPLLAIVYALIFLYALGYGWVALGAKKLKQIEDV